MAEQFLDKFRSSLPEIQGRQILGILRDKRDSGELQTIEEFQAELTSLTERLLSERIMPSLQLFFGEEGEIINSETYNFMLQRIEDDLEAAFVEANTIDEVLDSHQNIITEVVLETIQLGINELDEQIALLEFINSNVTGFDAAQCNTFATTKDQSTTRGGPLGSVLYEGTTAEDDAEIDLDGERLRIGPTGDEFAELQDVIHVFDSVSTASNFNVNPETINIRNLIDGLQGTYWIYESLLNTPRAEGILHKIKLEVAATQDLNFVKIEPASPLPVTLESLTYEDNAGVEQTIPISETLIKKTTKIEFGKVTARSITFHFRQKNYRNIQFEKRVIDENYGSLVFAIGAGEEIPEPPMPPPPPFDLLDIVAVVSLRDVIGLPNRIQLGPPTTGLPGQPDRPPLTPTPIPEMVDRFNYTIGFDNLSTGFAEFKSTGIFVSKTLEVEAPGLIVLRVVETRPGSTTVTGPISIDTDVFDEARFYHGSVEYSIVKENFNEAGQPLEVERFNIFPLGRTRVVHERIDLVEKSSTSSENDIGFFRFFPDPAASDPDVFRDGTLLTKGADWDIDTTETNLFDQEDPNNTAAMRKAIIILDPTLDVYTVTYTPFIGNSKAMPLSTDSIIDVVSLGDAGRIRLSTGNLIFTDLEKAGQTIAKSNLYLIILFRRNSAELAQSPSVEEYLLGAGQGLATKFDS